MSEKELRMAIIFRADCLMPAGKMAAQAGHAVATALLAAYKLNPAFVEQYMNESQTKIVLLARNLGMLQGIQQRAIKRGVPNALITDAGRTVFPEPTVTVLGLGPMSRTDYNNLTRDCDLFPMEEK